MKNHSIVILALLLWGATNTSLTLPWNLKFDVTKNHANSIVLQDIEQQLINNIWYKENHKLLFSEIGIVSVISDDTTLSHNWRVEQEGQVMLLKMITLSCGELVYRIEKDGNSLRWIDAKTNLSVRVSSTPLEKNARFMKVHKDLVGTWNSSIYTSTIIDNLSDEEGGSILSADFKYALKADGTFENTISINRKKKSTVYGVWQLSEDAEQLILHFQKKDCTYETIVADIRLLTMDELVLGKALVTSDLEKQLCREKKTFFYNKQ
ncbi:MAG: hypothetical protein AAFP82_05975 [Bacteroidota bacterium]